MDIGNLEVNDEVLVEVVPGQLKFAPVLTFIHRIEEREGPESEYIEVSHKRGTFRASANHMVFTCGGPAGPVDRFVGDLKPGDRLCAVEDQTTVNPSEVLAVKRRDGGRGMVAPLTAVGTIVVDNVVASNYATTHMSIPLSHGLAHKAMMPLRAYYNHMPQMSLAPFWGALCDVLGWESMCTANGKLELHPYVYMLHSKLHLDRLLTIR